MIGYMRAACSMLCKNTLSNIGRVGSPRELPRGGSNFPSHGDREIFSPSLGYWAKKIFPVLGTGRKKFPDLETGQKKFSQSRGLGEKNFPISGTGQKKFSQSRVLGEKIFPVSGTGRKNFPTPMTGKIRPPPRQLPGRPDTPYI